MSVPASSPPADPVASLSDFSDRFSPIIVKELRQGLRQPSFVILFLFLQSLLAIAVLTSLATISGADMSMRLSVGKGISGFFFGLFGLAALVLQPTRGISAIAKEVKENTIDLLVLTRLDSWRIVFGKWLSLVTQSGLLLVAILPYLMIRYFLGGMDLLLELGLLVFVFLLGAMFCAVAVGVSAVRSVIIRTIVVIVGLVFFVVMLQGFGTLIAFRGMGIGTMFGTMMTARDATFFFTGLVLLMAFLTFASLEFAATRIAPPAENRSVRKRLVALLAILVVPATFSLTVDDYGVMVCISVMLIMAFSMLDALTENPVHAQLRKFQRVPGCRPGWPDGSWFCLVMVFLAAAWSVLLMDLFRPGSSRVNDMEEFQFFIGLIAVAFAQPVLIVALARERIKDPPTAYLASLLGITSLGLVILMVIAVTNADGSAILLFPFFPAAALPAIEDASAGGSVMLFAGAACYLVIAGVIGRNATAGSSLSRK